MCTKLKCTKIYCMKILQDKMFPIYSRTVLSLVFAHFFGVEIKQKLTAPLE